MAKDPLCLVPLFASYLGKVQCNWCGTEIYLCESDAISEAEHQILCCGARSIDELKGNLRRICAGCEHFLNKDD
jgi:hypothetical protein